MRAIQSLVRRGEGVRDVQPLMTLDEVVRIQGKPLVALG